MRTMTKTLISVIMTIVMAVTLPACGTENGAPASTEQDGSQIGQPAGDPQNGAEAPADSGTSAVTDGTAEDTSGGSKTAVYYFSATGNTKEIAQIIAEETGAELIEIVPQSPYTSDDLDYGNDGCRANREQNDSSARPEFVQPEKSIEDYDVVFLGYPIWWGEEPRIIDTFIESADFSQKTVIPFCTSGGSGIETSVNNIRGLAEIGDLGSGRRFSAGASRDSVSDWLKGLGIAVDGSDG